ncbi:MAG TPA: protein kinase [Thermoanaerobaculia bacterium]|nr:protein kinase [Thermoanaerobaculia bacterium]
MKLGRYEVVRELGKGAMGIVYLAKDPLIGRLVALKTIRVAAHADDDEAKEFQQRFIREAQAAGILNHPAIVTVHDIGQDDTSGVSFIAMEYVEGQNLKEVLNQGRALSFEQIGDIIAQVGEALDFAHAKGIVHRDVKPANIILVEGYRAKITDFGIAKIASGAANLTTTGQFLGTPNYMAPEQVKGAPVDGRTDIFALGICLYECLTRRKPFGGDSLTSISYKIVHEPFPPLNEINPQIPEGFEDVVSHSLAKDPAKRYQRARDLANALRAVIRGDKPARPSEPLLADETMVTRDRGPVVVPAPPVGPQLTVEVPFPQALDASPVPGASNTRPASASPPPSQQPAMAKTEVVAIPKMPPIAPAAPPPAAPPVSSKTVATPMPKEPVSQQLRRTLTNVRALPLWKRHIPPAIFIAIVAVLVLGLLGAVVALKMQQPTIPVIDRAAEGRNARARQLRLLGEQQLREGRVADAHTTYTELQKLAPKSPFVANVLQKLNAILQQEELSKQQLAAAKQRYEQGLALMNEKRFAEAIVVLQESFSINPNSIEAADALKVAQAEQVKVDQARALSRQQQRQARQQQLPTTTRTDTAVTTTTQAPVVTEPAKFTTIFNHAFNDGRIIVRVGGDIVANEPLFTERRRRVIGTLAKTPRPIAVTNDFPPKSADITVWITVAPAGVNEQHTLPGVRFESGRNYRLVVRYNQTLKRFSYELN